MSMTLTWFLIVVFCIIAESFYSSLEMAMVSFNKVKLHYYVSQGRKRALWLNWLLHHPYRLFGTTLLGVNIAMQCGSEASRRFYTSINLDPDFAPLTQVILVLIFAELAPIFAARRYAERMTMMGMPLIYISAKIMTPFIWVLKKMVQVLDWILGVKEEQSHLLLSREELQSVVEALDEEIVAKKETDAFNVLSRNIFTLRSKGVENVMEGINEVPMLSSNSTVAMMRKLVEKTPSTFYPIYQRDHRNVVAVVTPRDVIRANDAQRVRDFSRTPWFITSKSDILDILNQFRRNNQTVAVVLNTEGKAVGVLTLDGLLEEIFGKIPISEKAVTLLQSELRKGMVVDRTFPGTMKVREFCELLNVEISCDPEFTLAELIKDRLGHHPEVGDSTFVDPFEMTVSEISLLEIKSIKVQT